MPRGWTSFTLKSVQKKKSIWKLTHGVTRVIFANARVKMNLLIAPAKEGLLIGSNKGFPYVSLFGNLSQFRFVCISVQ